MLDKITAFIDDAIVATKEFFATVEAKVTVFCITANDMFEAFMEKPYAQFIMFALFFCFMTTLGPVMFIVVLFVLFFTSVANAMKPETEEPEFEKRENWNDGFGKAGHVHS